MNILHHKSWHVRNKNNIARVRRDEQKAKEEEEAKEKRRLLAESEARVNLLRTKAHLSSQSAVEDNVSIVGAISAILDGKEPSSVGEDRKNVEHEKETKKEKEEWEKKVGILTYLGQGCTEIDKPWYLLDHSKRWGSNLRDEKKSTTLTDSSDKPDIKHKSDPLIDMERYLDVMKKSKRQIPTVTSISSKKPAIPTPTVDLSQNHEVLAEKRFKRKRKDKKSKKKKHRSKHKKSYKHSKSSRRTESSSSSSESLTSEESEDENENEKRLRLEALRAERIRREKAERERTMQLLNKSIVSEPKVEVDERKRGYNSQFNPHLAKQNLEKKSSS